LNHVNVSLKLQGKPTFQARLPVNCITAIVKIINREFRDKGEMLNIYSLMDVYEGNDPEGDETLKSLCKTLKSHQQKETLVNSLHISEEIEKLRRLDKLLNTGNPLTKEEIKYFKSLINHLKKSQKGFDILDRFFKDISTDYDNLLSDVPFALIRMFLKSMDMLKDQKMKADNNHKDEMKKTTQELEQAKKAAESYKRKLEGKKRKDDLCKILNKKQK
jgi:hypothetical protein